MVNHYVGQTRCRRVCPTNIVVIDSLISDMSDMIDVRIFILDELYTVVELVDRGLSSKVLTLLPILPIFGRANFVLILLYSIATMSVTLRLPTAFRNNVSQSIWFDINSYGHCQTKSDCLCSLPLLPL